jgi:hypothetical protein
MRKLLGLVGVLVLAGCIPPTSSDGAHVTVTPNVDIPDPSEVTVTASGFPAEQGGVALFALNACLYNVDEDGAPFELAENVPCVDLPLNDPTGQLGVQSYILANGATPEECDVDVRCAVVVTGVYPHTEYVRASQQVTFDNP